MLNYFNRKNSSTKKGFTLIELIVVISVIAILVLLATPWFNGYLLKAKEAQIQHNTRIVQDVLDKEIIENDDKLPDGLVEIDPTDPVDEGMVYGPEGPVDSIEPGPYRDITDMIGVVDVNHNLPGKFIANDNGKVYYVHNKPSSQDTGAPSGPIDYGMDKGQPMTDEQVQLMLDDGWIPVAHPWDFEKVMISKYLLGTDFVFAEGTKWEGTYHVPENPKFLQVDDIYLTSAAVRESYCKVDMDRCPPEGEVMPITSSYRTSADGLTYNGDYNKIYPGANAVMDPFWEGGYAYFDNPTNSKFEKMIFYGYEEQPLMGEAAMSIVANEAENCIFEDIWVENMHLDEVMAFFDYEGFGNTYNNVHFEGSMTSDYLVYGAFAKSAKHIVNSTVHADINGTGVWSGSGTGGFASFVGLIENSSFTGSIIVESGHVGGIAGSGGLAVDTHVNAEITANYRSGFGDEYDDYYIGGIFGIGDQNGGYLLDPAYPQYPLGAAVYQSSASVIVQGNVGNVGGLIGMIPPLYDIPWGSNAIVDSSADISVISTAVEKWDVRKLVGIQPYGGTWHQESCPLFDEAPWVEHDPGCGCYHYEVVNEDLNYLLLPYIP